MDVGERVEHEMVGMLRCGSRIEQEQETADLRPATRGERERDNTDTTVTTKTKTNPIIPLPAPTPTPAPTHPPKTNPGPNHSPPSPHHDEAKAESVPSKDQVPGRHRTDQGARPQPPAHPVGRACAGIHGAEREPTVQGPDSRGASGREAGAYWSSGTSVSRGAAAVVAPARSRRCRRCRRCRRSRFSTSIGRPSCNCRRGRGKVVFCPAVGHGEEPWSTRR